MRLRAARYRLLYLGRHVELLVEAEASLVAGAAAFFAAAAAPRVLDAVFADDAGRVELFFAVRADAAHEALRDDAEQRARDEVGLYAHVGEARDGADGVVRVERREYEVARQRGLYPYVRGVEVAHFAYHYDVGVLAQNRAQRPREGEAGLFVDLHLPDAGEVRVCGCDVRKDFMEIRRMIGYMPGHFSLYQDLTVEENLSLFAAVFNTTIQENYHLVAEIYSQLEPFRKRRAGRLSGGMKQKLALCCAMIHKPRVLFLDEPTTGVDPVSRKEFWQMLARLKAQGITIVVSTPYMDEASKCDVISLMKDGRFFRTDTPEAIVKGFGKRMYELDVQGSIVRALDDVASVQGVQSCSPFGDRIHIVSPSLGREELSGRLSAIGYDTSSLREAEPTVEDCFIEFDSRQNE